MLLMPDEEAAGVMRTRCLLVNHDTSCATFCKPLADRTGGTEDEKGRTMVENRISDNINTGIFDPDYLQ